MKLHAVADGQVYGTVGREVYAGATGPAVRFERIGRLPVSENGTGALADRLTTTWPWKDMLGRVVGRYATTNLWPVSETVLVASIGRRVLVSHDAGASWTCSLDLPVSSGTAGVLPTSLCTQDGRLYLGEYPLDDEATPRVLASDDDGRTWTTVLTLPDVRHVHGVHADPYTSDVWVTTGDVDTECRIMRYRDGTLDVIGGGSQEWRAVDLVFTPEAVLWGMDCPYVETKRIFRLDRSTIDTAAATDDSTSPAPQPVHEVQDSVYYGTSVTVDGTNWVVFSTAVEVGPDSTAPGRETRGTEAASVVASSASSGYRSWFDLCTFSRRARVTDRVDIGGRLPRANAYVFLASDPEAGLFVNPYNATPYDGEIVRIPGEWYEPQTRPQPQTTRQ